MALHLILGFKSFNAQSAAEVIYAGGSGDEAAKALASVTPGKYARAERFLNPRGVPARLPDAPTQPEAAKTETKSESRKTKAQ